MKATCGNTLTNEAIADDVFGKTKAAKRNLQLAKLADFNQAPRKITKQTNQEVVYKAPVHKAPVDNIDSCESCYMLGENTFVEKIVETRIVCLGNYSLVKPCGFNRTFWVLSSKLKWQKPHGTKCRNCNGFVLNSRRLGEFQDSIHCKKRGKQDANDAFATQVRNLGSSNDGILYLDSDSMFTTKTLLQNNVSGPKYPVNYDENTVNAWLAHNKHRDEVVPQFGTIGQLITDFSYSLKGVWFDYCGRFDGCKVCEPKDDIRHLFLSDRLTQTAVVGFTFALHDYLTGTSRQKTQRITTWIRSCAKQHGYHLTRLSRACYHSMLFLLYLSEKECQNK